MENQKIDWKRIYAEAEKQVPFRKKVEDVICCVICLPGLIIVMPWVARLLLEICAAK